MDYKTLIAQAEVRGITAQDFDLPTLPPDSRHHLSFVAKRHRKDFAACIRQERFAETLTLSSYPAASSVWYADRRIRLIVWDGDLTIDGDLRDEDFSLLPLLIVRGNLTLRHWLRGGIPTFVGGSVRASGFIVGHYNDSDLYVGGDLIAAGYIPRAKPDVDLPDVAPHQVAGTIDARKFDNLDATEEALRVAFVDEVLIEEDGEVYLDEAAVFERASAGLAVWR